MLGQLQENKKVLINIEFMQHVETPFYTGSFVYVLAK